MESTTMNLGLLRRSVTLGKVADKKQRKVPLSFMSEEPYQRSWGVEILSMAGADLSRVASGTAPVLVNHSNDDQVGVVEKAWIEDSIGKAIARFGNGPRATEIYDDITVSGIRRAVSVGYVINAMEHEGIDEKGMEIFRVTDFTVLEISIVPTPADPTVGIGRDLKTDNHPTRVLRSNTMELQDKKVRDMSSEEYATTQDQWTPAQKEENRVSEILAIGKMHGFTDEAIKAVQDGTSLNQFRKMVLDKTRSAEPVITTLSDHFGSRGNHHEFSWQRLFQSQVAASGVDAGYEFEVIQETRNRYPGNYEGFAVPLGALQQRDIVAGTDSAGGYTIATDVLGGSFIESLRNRSMVMQMNPTVLTNLVGDVAIPSQATTATAYHVTETGAVTESSPTFGQVTLTPKRVGTYVEASKQSILQSSINIEQFIRNELALTIGTAVDAMAINGSGSSNEPTGILNTSNIGDVAGGTNGLAPTWAHIVELESDVANANADFGALGYLTNSKVRGKLKQVDKGTDTGQFVWDGEAMNGYKALVSNNVPSTLDKGTSTGVCSAIIFGNWSDLIIGYWGSLDIVIDPYTLATTGLVRITVNLFYDIAVKRAASFSAMQDALTA